MTLDTDREAILPRSAGFAKPPFISNISVLLEKPFYVHELPPGYIEISEALKAYHAHCLGYEVNRHGRSVLLSMAELSSHIANGAVQSFHVGPIMKVRKLYSEDWKQDGPVLKRLYHEVFFSQIYDDDMKYRTVINRNVWVFYIKIIDEDENKIGGQVTILIDDLLKIINSRNTAADSADPASTDEVFISRGGRPPQHDSDLFLIEAFRIAYLDGAPSSQAELMERTACAYRKAIRVSHNSNRLPGETWMKERIRPVWKIIEERRKGALTG